MKYNDPNWKSDEPYAMQLGNIHMKHDQPFLYLSDHKKMFNFMKLNADEVDDLRNDLNNHSFKIEKQGFKEDYTILLSAGNVVIKSDNVKENARLLGMFSEAMRSKS